jgi:hypothetical protein
MNRKTRRGGHFKAGRSLKAMLQKAERGELDDNELKSLTAQLRAIKNLRTMRAQLDDWAIPPDPSKQ